MEFLFQIELVSKVNFLFSDKLASKLFVLATFKVSLNEKWVEYHPTNNLPGNVKPFQPTNKL